MKKLGVIIFSIALLFTMAPAAAMAAESSTFEEELSLYLGEISAERGFAVTKEDLGASLSTYGLDLSYFTTIDEIRSSFGDVMKADLSNLSGIYESYDLDETELIQLLADNGEELKDYIFVNDLDYAVYFYTYNDTFERDPNFDDNLVNYLASISFERGFEITKEMLAASLSIYGTNLGEFETVTELSEYMGEVIKADLSNLSMIYDTYEINRESLFALLDQNGKSINDYIFVYDLNEVTYTGTGQDPIFDEEMLADLLDMLDISEAELQNLADYMETNEAYFSDPAFLEAFLTWTEHFSLLETLDEAGKLSEEQAKEVAVIFNQYFDLLKVRPVILLTQDGKETQMSFQELALLKEFDYKATDIKVAIYGTDSQFLADFIITDEFIRSIVGEFDDIAEDLEEVIEEDNQDNDKEQQINKPEIKSNIAVKTVKGGKLPKTSTNYIPSALLGFFLAIVGILMYKRAKNVKSKESK